MSPQRHQQAAPLQPHAGARGRDDLRVVPQRARQHERQAAQGGHDDRRELHELPCREARTVLWEHAPVSESCATCHDPHGSNNDRMLVSKQPFLCQRCHVTSRHPPTVYEGSCCTTPERQQDLRAGLHQLPPDGARIEFAIRQGAAALGEEDDMRNRLIVLTAALLLTAASRRWRRRRKPHKPPAPARCRRSRGTVDVGGLFTATDGDEARYQRYRDKRDGCIPSVDLNRRRRRGSCSTRRRRTSAIAISSTAPVPGPEGELRISLGQSIPLNYSYLTRTPFTTAATR